MQTSYFVWWFSRPPVVRCEHIEGTGILLMHADAPFTVDHALAFDRSVARGERPDLELDRPTLLDIRNLRLGRIPPTDVFRYVIRRRAMSGLPKLGALAIVCGDIGTMGVLRLFGVVAHMSRLREEQLLLVTFDMSEAVAFLADHAGLAEEAHSVVLAHAAYANPYCVGSA